MAKLRNTTGHPLDLHAPDGDPESYQVDAGGQVEVGEVTELDDAYQTGDGDGARLWPKQVWSLVGAKSKADSRTEKADTDASTDGSKEK